MKYLVVTVICLSIWIHGGQIFAQEDSLQIQSEIGLMGRWQIGNLNQLVVSPNARLNLSKRSFSSDYKATYQYLRVEGFSIINDLWMSELFRLAPQKRVHPVLFANYGFAKSYRIDQAFVGAAGVGINILPPSPAKSFTFHAFAGYLDFTFEGEDPHRAPLLGSLTRAFFPLKDQLSISWELQTFHSLSDKEHWGANNSVFLYYQITKHLSASINHSTIYNQKTVEGIENTNMLMLFGFQFKR